MTPLPPVADVLKARFLWSDSSDINVSSSMFFHYDGGPPSETDVATLAGLMYTAMAAPTTLWHTDTQLTGVEVTDLSEASGAQATHNAITPGVETGAPLAGGTCVVVGYSIARRYRGGKPRNYFPWASASDLNTRQQWTSSYVTLAQTNLSSVIATIIGSSGGSTTITNHANVSYYSGNDPEINTRKNRAYNFPKLRVDGPQVDVITSLTVRPAPGSQRRRNR
jgi:hypothetical protein